ncbi:exodeoxyribonuclease V subunit beta [Desulfospira joergensenii]|uniref:exodeoxyribonuclease V subunit beta n=1 Tax=Desulfospira joergensenii TaxID=53329 RepID=UPI0003B367E8|nr:exodeoxyribonuclease V subunit beta [Desulfospira joergensenii]
MKPLDPYGLDLEKATLIEASAGTGKTYTITTLMVRLIALGFPVESILVVTFTEAAAAELKLRIRQRLAQGLRFLEDLESGKEKAAPGDELAEHLGRMPDPGLVRRRISHSLICFDQAPIMTIHSFCFKTLREHAFESGAYFDAELAPDSSSFLNQVCMDFFMTRINDMDPLDLAFLDRQGATPDGFIRDFRPVVSQGVRDIIPKTASFREIGDEYRALTGKIHDLLKMEKQGIIDFIQGDKGLDKRSYTKKNVPAWLGASLEKLQTQGRDAFFVMEEKGDPLFRFTASSIAAKTKSGFSPPCHEFFDLCQDLAGLYRIMEQNLISLRLSFLTFFDRELEKIKANQGICFFDDLVSDLARALEGPEEKRLRTAVREKYRACLIDEFQDTDPRQYSIFSSLFSTPFSTETESTPFFMIGDPKQAIYAFRGGDIFAYLSAAKESGQRFTLEKNYRSSPLLVRGINHVFSLDPRPFLFEGIEFTPVGTPETAVNLLLEQGKSVPPLRFTFLAREENSLDRRGFIKREHGMKVIPRILARQIAADLRSGFRLKDKNGEERVPVPGDAAVLVRTNVQAEEVLEALSFLNIPAYVSKTGSVFDAGEAMEFYTILIGAARSGHQGFLKAALATSVFGFRARDLVGLDRDESSLEKWQDRFRAFRDLWETRGVAAMFMALFHSAEGVLSPDSRISERGLTNFYHLIELASQAEQQNHLSMFYLLGWMETQLNPETRGETADELRLESDKKAVAIVTIHKSKGLEYPLVYLPYLWTGQGGGPGKGVVLFHDPDLDNRLRLDLRSGSSSGSDESGGPDRSRQLKAAEDQAEQRRLLYVALTRASAMCRIFWGGFSGVETSALGALLHPKGCGPDEDMIRDLEGLSALGKESIAIDPALDLPASAWISEAVPDSELVPRLLKRRIEADWRISSFSGMISSAKSGPGNRIPDRDPAQIHPPVPGPDLPILLKDFPKGAKAGDFFHAVLEKLDFGETRQGIKSSVTQNLDRFGFSDPGLLEPSVQAVQDILGSRLGSKGFCLKDIPVRDRFTELEFAFDVKDFRLSELAGLFEGDPGFQDYPDMLGRLGTESFTGFVKGFIDLVVRFKDKWYIIDYKSNFLGEHYGCYDRSAMESAMADHHYILQYHIYLAALDRYLELRLGKYEYERDFGGIFYLFIRGMHPDQEGRGVFFDRPPENRLRKLKACLAGSKPEIP